MSYYKLLGVKSDASEKAIRSAYRHAALQAHPDKPGGSAAKFKALVEAYDTLKDPRRRKEYNEGLKTIARVKSFSKPNPLPDVKQGARFPLPDGTSYEFEIAPDRFRCRFRHGDIVEAPTGKHGIIVGLASNGVYWRENGTEFAVLLFSEGFGGDRDIILVYRDRDQETRLRNERNAKLQEQQRMERQRMKVRQDIIKLQRTEATTRQKINDAVDALFMDFHKSVSSLLNSQPPHLSRERSHRQSYSQSPPNPAAAHETDEWDDMNESVNNKYTPTSQYAASCRHASGENLKRNNSNSTTSSANRKGEGARSGGSSSQASSKSQQQPSTPRKNPEHQQREKSPSISISVRLTPKCGYEEAVKQLPRKPAVPKFKRATPTSSSPSTPRGNGTRTEYSTPARSAAQSSAGSVGRAASMRQPSTATKAAATPKKHVDPLASTYTHRQPEHRQQPQQQRNGTTKGFPSQQPSYTIQSQFSFSRRSFELSGDVFDTSSSSCDPYGDSSIVTSADEFVPEGGEARTPERTAGTRQYPDPNASKGHQHHADSNNKDEGAPTNAPRFSSAFSPRFNAAEAEQNASPSVTRTHHSGGNFMPRSSAQAYADATTTTSSFAASPSGCIHRKKETVIPSSASSPFTSPKSRNSQGRDEVEVEEISPIKIFRERVRSSMERDSH